MVIKGREETERRADTIRVFISDVGDALLGGERSESSEKGLYKVLI